MNRTLVVTMAVGVVVIAAAVTGIFYIQRGAHIDLPGKVLKVRLAALDENSSVAVLDFRISNPADYPFMVRTVTVVFEDAAGNRADGATVSETDARRMFELLPLLGAKYNDTLIVRDRVASHSSQDRMVAARFEAPEAKIASRKRFVLRIEEVDGKVVEIPER